MPSSPRVSWATQWDMVVVPENRSAYLAARRIFRALKHSHPTPEYSPLLIYGPHGCGKTTLLSGLARVVRRLEPACAVEMISARDLSWNGILEANSQHQGIKWYRDCELLLIEDLQYLPLVASDLLCELLDARKSHRRPTVISSVRGPAKLLHLSRRLTSRLSAGLVVGMTPMGPSSRKRIITEFARRRGLKLTADAIDALSAEAQAGSLRPLFGRLNALASLVTTKTDAVDGHQVRELLKTSGQQAESVSRTAVEIMFTVASEYGLTADELLSPTRTTRIREARQVTMFLIRQHLRLSFPQIGELFHGRDPSTVQHACQRVRLALRQDMVFSARIRDLEAQLELTCSGPIPPSA